MFASELRSGQQATHSLRASHYRKGERRKRDLAQERSASPEPHTSGTSISKSHPYASYASPEVAQLRTAGLSQDDEDQVPPSPFPHAAARAATGQHGPGHVEQELAQSPIRLYDVNADLKRDTTSLKTQHLNVLTAVLHRCLMDEDYERAGRAWGMLLRSQIAGGHHVDPRNNERWGVGAEILLRRGAGAALNAGPGQAYDSHALSEEMFTEEGFELAREYYERLIIQHPYRTLHPHSVDERSFYPAMFSLWIFEVSEKGRRAKRKMQLPRSESRSMSHDSVMGEEAHEQRTREEAIRREELARATEIAQRLDQLVASPPFDRQASLLDLRGQVCLWMSALIAGDIGEDEDWDMDRSDQSLDEDSAARLAKLTSCERELRQAQHFFQRAEASGAPSQVATLSSIDLKLIELSRQSAKFRVVQDDW